MHVRFDAANARRLASHEFFGVVGSWYTVGYRMAVVIEKTLGRDALIAAICDHRHLLATYNRSVRQSGERLPLWPERLAKAFD